MTTNQKEWPMLALPSEVQPNFVRSSLRSTLFLSLTKYWMIQVRRAANADMAAMTFQVIMPVKMK